MGRRWEGDLTTKRRGGFFATVCTRSEPPHDAALRVCLSRACLQDRGGHRTRPLAGEVDVSQGLVHVLAPPAKPLDMRDRPRYPEHMLIDCHAHLTAEAFAADLEAVLGRAHAAGVGGVLVVGEDLADDHRVANLVGRRSTPAPVLLPCFGFHPDRFAEDNRLPPRARLEGTLALIREHAWSLAAIGEVGLDGWMAKTEDRRRAQEVLLEEMASLAIELGLPLNVHSRSAGQRTLDVLRAAGARQVLMHAFDGRAVHAVRAAEAGYLFSIPPSVVRSPQKQKLVRRLPLESLALESDAPVLGPDAGQRNEPANLSVTRDYIAAVQRVTAERVEEVTTANALRLFPKLKVALGAKLRRDSKETSMAHDHGPHEHGHKFDPANIARLDSPARRERMPPAAVVAAVDLHPGMRLADIGVGTGYLLFPLLEAIKGQGTFFAVDISTEVLEVLRRRLSAHPLGDRVQVVLGEEGHVSLLDESLDVVVMGAVLHEFADLAASLAEVWRVLVPGGQVAAADWDRRPEQHGEAEHGPPYEHRVPREEAEAALTAAGFTDIRLHPGFRDAYLLSARRV